MSVFIHFGVEQCDQTVVVSLSDDAMIDRGVIVELCDELTTLVDQQMPQKLLLSFSGVARISSEVISVLIRVRKQLLVHGRELALCDINDETREALRILRLDGTLFRIFSSRSEALVAMNGVS